MKELKIFDKTKENKRLLIPLTELLKWIAEMYPERILHRQWTVFKGADGYGERICEISDELEDKDSLVVDGDELFDLLCKGKQYFEHARIKVGDDIEFGVFDSTFLFLRGDEEMVRKIGEKFQKTAITEVYD